MAQCADRGERREREPQDVGSDAHTIAPIPVGVAGLSLGNATWGPLASPHRASTAGSDQ
jgi:hypothetical protein